MRNVDTVVVGSGPNGLAGALTLARAGHRVVVYEGAATLGGGCQTAELTLPGFLHDVCSAVHPLVLASPFFRTVDLTARGVKMLSPPVAFAHPLDGGRAAAVGGSVEDTARNLGTDAKTYRRLFGRLVPGVGDVIPTILGPLRNLPAHSVAMARLALPGLMSASWLARLFKTEEARALLAGAAAHSVLTLDQPLTGSYALLFVALGHTYGWPVVEGGTGRLVDALADELASMGTEFRLGRWVTSLDELGAPKVALMDVSPRRLAGFLGERAAPAYRRGLERYRYGPGVCKVDWALSGPVPWAAASCREAGTIHLGGSFEQIAAAEAEVAAGRHPDRPFCIVAQPGVVDGTRAPAGSHTLWAYCHVPAGSRTDMTERIEAQIERFAPGFRQLVQARASKTAVEMAGANPNYVGGDISGGMATLRQTIFRPTVRWDNYATGVPGVYICSASSPPGGGVHGMCGYWAAQTALKELARSG